MMKRVLLSLSVVLAAFACSLGPSLERPAHEVSGPGFRIIHLGENRSSDFAIDLSITEPSDVFVIFTNPTSGEIALPELRVSPESAFESLALSFSGKTAETTEQAEESRLFAANAAGDGADALAVTTHRGNARLGVPGLRDVEADWLDAVGTMDAGSGPEGGVRLSGSGAGEYVANESRDNLYRLANASSLTFTAEPATVRYVSEQVSGFRLVIWVEDTLWENGSTPINQEMVDALGNSFTDVIEGTSAFQTVLDVFGTPWGTTRLSGVLPADTESVHVFLANIAGRGNNLDNGFIAGYFFAQDVFRSATSGNEKLMIYVHGPAFATGNSPWRLTDFWPSEMALTTAHELQHLIKFYQSSARIGQLRTREEQQEVTWLDELLSLLSEEVVADRLRAFAENEELPYWQDSFLGPRGVAPGVRRPEDPVSTGRLTDFVLYPDRSLTFWPKPDDAAASQVRFDYAASYAFGTWLVRNYGGVGLLPRIYGSMSPGYRAVEDAVRLHTGESVSFGELLERWAAANVLSDRNIPARSYRLFGSDWFRSRPTITNGTSATEIRLGDIPFGTYQQSGGTNTGLFTFLPNGDSNLAQAHGFEHAPHSNIYFQAATGHTGALTLDLSAARGGRTTIIILENQ